MPSSDVRFVVVLAATVACGFAAAAEPKTAKDFQRQEVAWLGRKFQDDFAAHGTPDAAWADDYRAFLADWAQAAGEQYPPATMKTFETRAAALAAAGCDDPVFGILRGRIELGLGRPKEALAAFRKLADVQKAGYPAFFARLALLWSREAKAAIAPAAAVVPEPDKALYQTALAIAKDPAFADGNQWIYVAGVAPETDAFTAAAAERFAKPDSGVDPWITAMFVGRDHTRRAYAARGDGSAATVTPEGWKALAEHLALAREQFTRAHEMHPEWPQAAHEMIRVCLGDGSDEARLWFDRAVAAQFDCLPAYDMMLRRVLLPRWGGSHEAMLDFGRECLGTGRFDTGVPWFMYTAVAAVGEELPDPRDVVAMPGVYDDCLKMCRGYLAAVADPDDKRTLQSLVAVLQWATGRHAEACQALDELRDELMPNPLRSFRARAEDVVGESRLLGGPHAEAFAAAESLVEQNKIEDALAAYRPLATKDDLPAAAQRIVEGRIKTLENAVAIASHEWVDLQPQANLAGWRRVFGDWKVAADGTLVGAADEQGRLKLLCESELGQDVEITFDCDLTDRPTREKLWYQLMILLAHAAGEDERDRAIGVRLLAFQRMVQVGALGVAGPVGQVPAAIKDTNEVRIVLWDWKVSVFVNGQRTVNKFELPPEALAGGGLGIADSVRGGEPPMVRIRTLRARKLDKAPDDF